VIEQEEDKSRMARPSAAGPGGGTEDLPYRVELWDASRHDCVERVLAHASSAPLARAIFKAARTEHPDRRITLCRGKRVVADSAE
jgi:hypothetical protein